jgi:hypothetical protein
MRFEDAQFWDAHIQPVIRQKAFKHPEPASAPRADARWRWTPMRTLLPLTQLLQGRRCRALTVLVQDTAGNAVPAGMLFLIERYHI